MLLKQRQADDGTDSCLTLAAVEPLEEQQTNEEPLSGVMGKWQPPPPMLAHIWNMKLSSPKAEHPCL